MLSLVSSLVNLVVPSSFLQTCSSLAVSLDTSPPAEKTRGMKRQLMRGLTCLACLPTLSRYFGEAASANSFLSVSSRVSIKLVWVVFHMSWHRSC